MGSNPILGTKHHSHKGEYMKLILNGGGSGAQIKESWQLFAKLVKGGKVLYIPFAWKDETYAGCLEWFSADVRPYGITDIEMVTAPEQITKEQLKSVQGVFIGGGNTYKLLKMLKESPAYNNLKDYMAQPNAVIMGGSAGALIFGKSIDTCLDDGLQLKHICDVNFMGLKDTTGFNCLHGFSILPHYQKLAEQNTLTEKRVKRLLKEGYKLICIPEETSIFINNDTISIVGSKPAAVFTKNREIRNIQNEEISYLNK